MQAETLNCPTCGAAAETDAVRCLYCSSRLATVACPSCFGMMFLGSRHCPGCGARAARAEVLTKKARSCPRCRTAMEAAAVGSATLSECGRCGGVWVDAETFELICADREQQSAVLTAATLKPAGAHTAAASEQVRYVPCPECGQLMNRTNFARCSGVVIDVCKGHGTWFDRDELQRIVEFIRGGGLATARAREIEQLAEERRRLREEQLAAAARGNSLLGSGGQEDCGLSSGLTAGELLKLLFD